MNPKLKNSTTKTWTPGSWKTFKISQQPEYKDKELLESIKNKISSLPPMVNYKEILTLRSKLELCHEEQAFVIQVGDCAERFIDANEEVIQRQIIFFNMLSQILAYNLKKEIIIIGRIAGQYAKPRSNTYDTLSNGEKLEVFRGDIINEFTPEAEKRVPDPERMSKAYYNSITTINQIKNWNLYGDKSLENFSKLVNENKYEIKSDKFIKKLLEYYNKFPHETHMVEGTNIYTSHEGLLLNYEECFLRKEEDNYYDLSSHFLWIGERTSSIDEAHIEFFRGVNNPIGMKISSRTNLEELVQIIKLLNPHNEKAKIVLITRFGLDIAENCIESLCKKISQNNLEVIFICDPNHGNTKQHDEYKKKVRYFEELKDEIIISNNVLLKYGFYLSGIHLEASSFNVTECLGGYESDVSEILDEHYTTYCDPRLNMLQAMELCDYVGQYISRGNKIDD